MSEPIYIIGIDPGTNTGIGVYHMQEKKLIQVGSMPELEAHDWLKTLDKDQVLLLIENPNTFFPGMSRAKMLQRAQGAGSIKHSYSQLVKICDKFGLPYQPIRLNASWKKLKDYQFTEVTGWTGTTNEHARDAAMICWDYKPPKPKKKKK